MANRKAIEISGVEWKTYQKKETLRERTFFVKSIRWGADLKTVESFRYTRDRSRAAELSDRKAASVVEQIRRRFSKPARVEGTTEWATEEDLAVLRKRAKYEAAIAESIREALSSVGIRL